MFAKDIPIISILHFLQLKDIESIAAGMIVIKAGIGDDKKLRPERDSIGNIDILPKAIARKPIVELLLIQIFPSEIHAISGE